MADTVFRMYCLGVAGENKSLTSRHLAIIPTERTPAMDGEIAFNPQSRTFSGSDKNGDPYQISVTEDATLTAEWLPMGSNRVTPPDVRRGEPVVVYRLADSGRYYWRCMGLRDDLRRLETVIWAFNANPDDESNGNGVDIDNCYFIEVSTHTKQITLGTTQKNGEPYGYGIQLDTAKGKFTLEDTIGNILHLDSAWSLWEMINSSGTHVRLDKKIIYMFAPDKIDMEATNLIEMRTRDLIMRVDNSTRLMSGNSIYFETGSFTTKSNQTTHDSPNSTYTGNLNVGGNLGIGGSMSTGTSGGGGNASIGGDASVSGNITCRRLTASENVSAPNL